MFSGGQLVPFELIPNTVDIIPPLGPVGESDKRG